MATYIEIAGLVIAVIELLTGMIVVIYKFIMRNKHEDFIDENSSICNKYGSALIVSLKFGNRKNKTIEIINNETYPIKLRSYLFRLLSLFRVLFGIGNKKRQYCIIEIYCDGKYLAYKDEISQLKAFQITRDGLYKGETLVKYWSYGSDLVWRGQCNNAIHYFIKLSETNWIEKNEKKTVSKFKLKLKDKDTVRLYKEDKKMYFSFNSENLRSGSSPNYLQEKYSGGWYINEDDSISKMPRFEIDRWISCDESRLIKIETFDKDLGNKFNESENQYDYFSHCISSHQKPESFPSKQSKGYYDWVYENKNGKEQKRYLEVARKIIQSEVVLFCLDDKNFHKLDSNCMSEGKFEDFLDKKDCSGKWKNKISTIWEGQSEDGKIVLKKNGEMWSVSVRDKDDALEYAEIKTLHKTKQEVVLFCLTSLKLVKLTSDAMYCGEVCDNVDFFENIKKYPGCWEKMYTTDAIENLVYSFREINECDFGSPTPLII